MLSYLSKIQSWMSSQVYKSCSQLLGELVTVFWKTKEDLYFQKRKLFCGSFSKNYADEKVHSLNE